MDKVNHNKFGDNLERANDHEEQIADILLGSFPEMACFGFNDDERWDIEMMVYDEPYNIEVKEDFKCFPNPNNNGGHKGTGFIVIEFESWGKRSGIYKSQADLWVYVVHKEHENVSEVYTFDPCWMKCFIKESRYHDIYQMTTTDSGNRVFRFEYDEIIKCPDFHLLTTIELM